MTLHLPSPANPSLPLCGRVLSRNTPLTQRNMDTMQVGDPIFSGEVAGFAAVSCKSTKVCRHCQRAAGLLPPLTRAWLNEDGMIEEQAWNEFREAEENEE